MKSSRPASKLEWALGAYAKVLLRLKKTERARRVFETLSVKRPHSLAGYIGLVDLAERAGDREAQLQVWQRVAEKFPKHRAGQLKYGEFLRITTRFDEAEAHYQNLLKKDPKSKKVLAGLAKTASSARNYDLAVSRWQALVERSPKDIEAHKHLIRALIETLDFDQAQSIYDQHLSDQSDIGYRLLQLEIYSGQSESQKEYEAISALRSQYPENQKILNRYLTLLTKLYRNTSEQQYADQALEALSSFELIKPLSPGNKESRIEVNIYLGKQEEALAQVSKLSAQKSKKNMQLRAWAAYMNGNVEASKSLWEDITRLHYPTRIRPPPAGSLRQTDSMPIELKKDSILLFTVVRNERWRLQWFLDYYRSLGVERFFFVDNNSSDGTPEFLHEQSDVHVFWTDHSYAKAYSGMQWVNWLVEQFGADCWCIYADVDEALVFPGAEQRGLRNLTNYMADHGQEAMYAFMLDMYAPHLQSTPRDNDYTGFLTDYPLFENEYSWTNTWVCPYRFTAGGIRRTFKLSENQTKTPLIRGGVGIKFLMSSHVITPASLSDVSGVLLHYKLAGDFKETFANDLTDNTRIARCKMRHWRYIEALEELPEDESFIHDSTVSFESSQQLVDLGIVNTTPAFEAGNYD